MKHIATSLKQLFEIIQEQFPEYTHGRSINDLDIILMEMEGSFNRKTREFAEDFKIQYQVLVTF